jgi:tight adherence protein C
VFGGLRLLVPAVLAALAALAHRWLVDAALAWTFARSRRRPAAEDAAAPLGATAAQVAEELPILIDMLRLLQGVGLSIDQSLQVIVTEFGAMLRAGAGAAARQPAVRVGTLARADAAAHRQAVRRRGPEGPDHAADAGGRHGGAVQEPLRQFGERLQVARKARMKDKIGRLTVKMTGVMVVSLLPVLLILTAGPGFLGVIRMLARMNGGH